MICQLIHNRPFLLLRKECNTTEIKQNDRCFGTLLPVLTCEEQLQYAKRPLNQVDRKIATAPSKPLKQHETNVSRQGLVGGHLAFSQAGWRVVHRHMQGAFDFVGRFTTVSCSPTVGSVVWICVRMSRPRRVTWTFHPPGCSPNKVPIFLVCNSFYEILKYRARDRANTDTSSTYFSRCIP